MQSKYFLFSLVALFFSFSLNAQSFEEFSETPQGYVSQIEEIINQNKSDRSKAIMKELETLVAQGSYSEQYDQIRAVSNGMLKKRMRAPYFMTWVETTNALLKSNNSGTEIEKWLSITEKVLVDLKKGKLKPFNQFLNFSKNFYTKKAFREVKGGPNWYVSDLKFKWIYEKETPRLDFENIALIGKRKQDSIVIENTSGRFFPLINTWYGTGGTTTWDRVGLENVKADYFAYTLETKKSEFEADSAILYYPSLFEKPLVGSFSEKITIGNKARGSSYPRFTSDAETVEIDDIGENVKYIGGFQLQGADVVGLGSKGGKATIELTRENKTIILARSSSFSIKKGEVILGQDVETSIYFGSDSLYHPGVSFRYDIPKKKLTLKQGDEGIGRAPFSNSYHKMNLDVMNLAWDTQTDSIVIGEKIQGSESRVTVLESDNYFDEKRYRRLQNISSVNPIAVLKLYVEEEANAQGLDKIQVVSAEGYAAKLNPRYGRNVSPILGLLVNLAEDGFVYYNSEDKTLFVTDKVYQYAQAATGNSDYDNLKLRSNTDNKKNGVINLGDNSMNIYGVRNFILSDSQLVVVKPLDEGVALRKNRNMTIDGQVYAGYNQFWGEGFDFNYKAFEMKMDSVRYLDIYIPTGVEDAEGVPELLQLNTRIQDLNGTLLIDAPNNKASQDKVYNSEKERGYYPAFKSKKNSYTYYDDYETQEGKYKRDEFYFEIEPFVFESMDEFDPVDLNFPGEFNSADIFPRFKESLKIQEDLSLGFNTITEATGSALYNKDNSGKGKYTGEISLSNKGLTGKGTVNYLSATINTEDAVFLPNQMTATADSLNIDEQRGGTEVPQVDGAKIAVDWTPYNDSMYIESTENSPFNFFGGTNHTLAGNMVLSKKGLYGGGVFDWDEAVMNSDQFHFLAKGVEADSLDLSIKALNEDDKIAFNTKNVEGVVNFETNLANFESRSDEANTEMPYNQYKTSMNKFEWDMKRKTVEFESTGSAGAEFVTTKEDQGDLRFKGQTANYNLETSLLKIGGVKYIIAGDAFIYPGDERVEIEAEAKMRTLNNARIVADTVNRYHVIENATVNILGKKSYTADGFYKYNVGPNEQQVQFNNIKTTEGEKVVTIGKGSIGESSNFLIDLKTRFKGNVELRADDINLKFTGYAKLNLKSLPNTRWFSINSRINRKNVAIAYNEPRAPRKPEQSLGDKLYVGMSLSRDSLIAYSRIMQAKPSARDRTVFNASGAMRYVASKNEYFFGDSLAIRGKKNGGNVLKLNDSNGKITMTGNWTLCDKLKHIDIIAYGKGETYAERIDGHKYEMLVALDLPLPEEAWLALASDLSKNTDDRRDIEYSKSTYAKEALMQLNTNAKDLAAAEKSLQSVGRIRLPEKSPYKIVFGKVPMIWDENEQSFQSKGAVGISSVNGSTIEKFVTSYVEFRMGRMADELIFYIESPSEDYYYISYSRSRSSSGEWVLKATSSNSGFNNAILGLKKKEARIKKKNSEFINIGGASSSEANFFVRRMRSR